MRILQTIMRLLAVIAVGFLAACGTSTQPETTTPAAAPTSEPAAETPAEEPSEPASEEAPDEGTSEPAEGDVPRGDGSQVVYLVSMGFQHQYWQAVRQGAEAAGEEYGYQVEFVGPDDESQVTQQMNLLKTAFDTRPAAIGLAALSGDAARPLLEEIDAAGIPVIAFDSGVDYDIPVTTVQTDNVGAAEEVAKRVIEWTGGEGTIGLVCHDQTSQVGQERCDGFQNYIREHAPGMEMTTPQYANQVDLAANTALAMVQANPDIVAVYGANEAAAGGAVQGVRESGRTDIGVFGFDSGATQMDAIRAGAQVGAVTQAPVRMGYETVVAAAKAIHGQELPKIIDSGFAWFDAENMDDPEIADNLYE